MGIEPTFLAWEANVLPLDDTRVVKPIERHPRKSWIVLAKLRMTRIATREVQPRNADDGVLDRGLKALADFLARER